jgi:hypothetical protein
VDVFGEDPEVDKAILELLGLGPDASTSRRLQLTDLFVNEDGARATLAPALHGRAARGT